MGNIFEYHKGQKFENLKLIEEDFTEKIEKGFQKYRMALVECFCGNTFVTRISGLKNGRVLSCGCKRKNKLLARITKHSMFKSSEYSSWESMKSRCLNPKNKFYKNYGGRGIEVCNRWISFENFIEDMGKKPDKSYSIDRIDVNGNYCLENCKWSSRYEQDRNRTTSVKFEINGVVKNIIDIAREYNLNQQTIRARVKKGMTIEEAVSKPYKYTKK